MSPLSDASVLAPDQVRRCIYRTSELLSSCFALLSLPKQVTLIPGDGIGAEITDSVKEIFEHVNAPIEWDQYDVSGMSSTGETLFKEAMESLKRNKVGLKGVYRLVPNIVY